jgi:hypothetical protein
MYWFLIAISRVGKINANKKRKVNNSQSKKENS